MPFPARSRTLVALALALAASTIAPSSAFARPPDFSHPDRPHFASYDPLAGTTDRPMLVIYERFADLPLPRGRGETWLARRIFGPADRNLVDYFTARSFGNLRFTRASESCGTRDNGVVVVDSGFRATWDAETDGQRIRDALTSADPCVDFAAFDGDSDGVLAMDELVILKMEVQPGDDGTVVGGGAAARAADPGALLDGLDLDWFLVGLVNSTTNLISTAHEVMHAGLGMARDWYQFGIDGYDIMGATQAPVEFYEGVSSWHAMHLGWAYPTVVMNDGYVTLPSYGTTGRSALLYDPAKGPRHYLLVENRTLDPGSYDEDPLAQPGLNVWRIDETRYLEDPAEATPIMRIRPCQGDACPPGWYFATFDAADATFPQRMVEVPWNDGTPSRVAIRAISPAGPTMRAFFDVPGPGVLLDCFSRVDNGYRRTLVIARGASATLRVPVMNTGDTSSRFDIGAVSPPSGWAVGGELGRSLPAHRQRHAELSIRIPAVAAPRTYRLRIEARDREDRSVASSCEVRVDVR